MIHVTLGPRLSLWSGLGRRRCRRGEGDDTVPGVADAWGRRAATTGEAGRRWREQRAGLASGARCCRARKLGWLAGPAAAVHKLGWLAGLLLFFSFPFFVLFFFSFV